MVGKRVQFNKVTGDVFKFEGYQGMVRIELNHEGELIAKVVRAEDVQARKK